MRKRRGLCTLEHLFADGLTASANSRGLLFQPEEQISRGWSEVQIIGAIGSRYTAAGRPAGRRIQIAILLQAPAGCILPIHRHRAAGMADVMRRRTGGLDYRNQRPLRFYIPGNTWSSADLRFEVGAFLKVSSVAATFEGRSMPLPVINSFTVRSWMRGNFCLFVLCS